MADAPRLNPQHRKLGWPYFDWYLTPPGAAVLTKNLQLERCDSRPRKAQRRETYSADLSTDPSSLVSQLVDSCNMRLSLLGFRTVRCLVSPQLLLSNGLELVRAALSFLWNCGNWPSLRLPFIFEWPVAHVPENWGSFVVSTLPMGNVFFIMFGLIFDGHSTHSEQGMRCLEGTRCYVVSLYAIAFAALCALFFARIAAKLDQKHKENHV